MKTRYLHWHKIVVKMKWVGAVFALFLAGCSALYGTPETPHLQVPARFKSTFNLPAKVPATISVTKWWQNFHDPKLNRLVELALKNNLNYQIAIKNIAIAKTYVSQNVSSLFPTIGLNYNAARNASSNSQSATQGFGQGRVFNLQQLQATVSYEIDVWNRIRNSVKQAQSNVFSSEADSQVIRLSLISDVTNTYFQVEALNANLANLRIQYALAIAKLKLLKTQYRGGLIDIVAVSDAETLAETIKSNLSSTDKQKQVAESALAYLVGKYPERFNLAINNMGQLPSSSDLIPPGLPSQLLAVRPDIQSAFYKILVAGYLQKQSFASFFPIFSLSGGYGYSSSALRNFVSNNAIMWNLAGNMAETLFDYANRASQYKRAKLQYESSILSYKNVVLNAFKEVDSALISYQNDYIALIASRRELAAAQSKLNLAKAQYQSGFNDYPTYLTADINFLQSKYNLINQNLLVSQDIVQVYKTLGLGL